MFWLRSVRHKLILPKCASRAACSGADWSKMQQTEPGIAIRVLRSKQGEWASDLLPPIRRFLGTLLHSALLRSAGVGGEGHSLTRPTCSAVIRSTAFRCTLLRSTLLHSTARRSSQGLIREWESGSVLTRPNAWHLWLQRFSASMWKESENRFEFSVTYFTRVSLALSRAEPFVSTTDNFCLTFSIP